MTDLLRESASVFVARRIIEVLDDTCQAFDADHNGCLWHDGASWPDPPPHLDLDQDPDGSGP